MKALFVLLEKGGPVMIAIIGLSVVLYTRCFHFLLVLRQKRRYSDGRTPGTPAEPAALRREARQLREAFQRQRISLGAMITAAPLLGLLGTVSGMASTFENLAGHSTQKSMEGLAGGISQVLVATESGLAVAIPALLLVYLAHREVHRYLQEANRREQNPQSGEAA